MENAPSRKAEGVECVLAGNIDAYTLFHPNPQPWRLPVPRQVRARRGVVAVAIVRNRPAPIERPLDQLGPCPRLPGRLHLRLGEAGK